MEAVKNMTIRIIRPFVVCEDDDIPAEIIDRPAEIIVDYILDHLYYRWLDYLSQTEREALC